MSQLSAVALGFTNIQSSKQLEAFIWSAIKQGQLVNTIKNAGDAKVICYKVPDSQIEIWVITDKKQKRIGCYKMAYVPTIAKKFHIDNVTIDQECNFCVDLTGGIEGDRGQYAASIDFETLNFFEWFPFIAKEIELSVSISGLSKNFNSVPKEQAQMQGCLMPARTVYKRNDLPLEFYGVWGEIVDIKRLKNSISGSNFGVISLKQEMVGTFEVVVPIERLAKQPKIGEIGQTECFLQGKINQNLTTPLKRPSSMG